MHKGQQTTFYIRTKGQQPLYKVVVAYPKRQSLSFCLGQGSRPAMFMENLSLPKATHKARSSLLTTAFIKAMLFKEKFHFLKNQTLLRSKNYFLTIYQK